MIITASAILGSLGIYCMVSKQSLLGIFIGFQLLIFGASLLLVSGAQESGVVLQGHSLALMLATSGICQLGVGFALAVRLFYLKRKPDVSQITDMRN